MTKSVTLTVLAVFAIAFINTNCQVSAATLLFDFGETSEPTAGNYNNISQAQLPLFNAIDSNGNGTGISLETAGFNPGSNQSGTQAPSGDAAIFDVQATRDNLFGHTSNFNQPAPLPLATLSFGGLDSSGLSTYDFTFFASRLGVGDNRETEYAVSGSNNSTVYLDTANNEQNIITASGIIPTAAGEVTISVSPGPNNTNGSGFYYLGAMQVTSAVIPEPGTCLLLSLGSVLLIGIRRPDRTVHRQ